MNALVRIEQDRVLADSRDVAREFGKEHRHVLRAIDTIVKEAPDLLPNFGQQLFEVNQNGAKRRYRRFDMDRKGFMLLVMGFNGAKALAIKSRWIDAFDTMERALMAQAEARNENDLTVIERPMVEDIGHQDLALKLAHIREIRMTYGRDMARRAWEEVGLPPVAGARRYQPGSIGRRMADAKESVLEWLGENVSIDGTAMTMAAELYADYVAWCAERGIAAESQTHFGLALNGLGHGRTMANSGRVYRAGLRLKN